MGEPEASSTEGGTTVSPSQEELESQGAVLIGAGDRPLLRYAAELARGAAKNAFRLNTSLRLENAGGAGNREAQAEQLMTRLDEQPDQNTDYTVAGFLVAVAEIGVGFYINKVEAEKKSQLEILAPDTKALDKLIKQLNALQEKLQGKGALPLGGEA